MEFINQPYLSNDTIAAIATPPGDGGVAIIRISGKEALASAEKIFSGPVYHYKSHTAHYGTIRNSSGDHIDDVLLLPFLGDRSYTGEDTVEIHCHGGSLITRRVLEVVLQSGPRAAMPGEFTFRAFVNGKIDLAQAEAVQELICAKNEHALDAAENQLKGALSSKILEFQETLTHITAILEAWVDFPEEGLEFASIEEILLNLETVRDKMQMLLDTFHDGRIVQDGISLCLIGSPNVGKSSLMNALLDKERAIVSHIPGTTRDTLEDYLRLNGLNLRLIDTAGIRDSSELIEQEGIRRSKMAMQEADLILLILDVSRAISDEERKLMEQVPKEKTILVWNKADLLHTSQPLNDFIHVVSISALKKMGLDLLKEKIDRVIWEHGPPVRDEVLITNVRHKEALSHAIEACERVIAGLQNRVSPEFLAFDMRQSLIELGKIIGINVTESILSAIFSKFCIGK